MGCSRLKQSDVKLNDTQLLVVIGADLRMQGPFLNLAARVYSALAADNRTQLLAMEGRVTSRVRHLSLLQDILEAA